MYCLASVWKLVIYNQRVKKISPWTRCSSTCRWPRPDDEELQMVQFRQSLCFKGKKHTWNRAIKLLASPGYQFPRRQPQAGQKSETPIALLAMASRMLVTPIQEAIEHPIPGAPWVCVIWTTPWSLRTGSSCPRARQASPSPPGSHSAGLRPLRPGSVAPCPVGARVLGASSQVGMCRW